MTTPEGSSDGTDRLRDRLRKRAGRFVVDSFFGLTSGAGRRFPLANPSLYGVEVIRDLPYGDGGDPAHRLDIYRPRSRPGPLPMVFYVHGGGFRILSKDALFIMALIFARRGFLTFTVDYRLAPAHPFPAGLADVCTAFAWVAQNATRWGGDPNRLVLAGESAGANLVTALTLACCEPRGEPWAAPVFDLDLRPRAVLPACGVLEVDRPERFRALGVSRFVLDRLEELAAFYLPNPGDFANLDLANPLVALESDRPLARPLPPFFAVVGSDDILVDDSRRLEAALTRRGVRCETRIYPGGMHAFHAFVWRRKARQAWADTFAFLDSVLAP